MARYDTFMGKLAKATIYRWNAGQVISGLRGAGDPACAAVAAALESASAHGPTGEEKRSVDAIESRRIELARSTALLPVMDPEAWRRDGGESPAQTAPAGYRTLGEMSSRASQPPRWAYLLFKIIREAKPSLCLELGTAFGISAAYQAAALELNNKGRLVTLEGADYLAAIAEETFTKLGAERVVLKRGRFEEILASVLAEYSPIDFAFIDGHHSEEATVRYFTEILPHLSDDAVLVLDDIAWSEGMERAWRTVSSNGRIATSVDLFKMGICTVGSSPRRKKSSYKTAFD